jgi:branched-chain amino acid transport system substrate-binding protein
MGQKPHSEKKAVMNRPSKRLTRRDFLKKSGAAAAALGTAQFVRVPYTHAAPPIKIGVTAELTGALADFGFWNARSARAAIQRINEAGGIAGREVALIVEDTESKPPSGVRKTRKLIQRDGVDFIFGSHHSGICLACNPILQELQTVGFPNGAATSITGAKGNPWVFRMVQSVLHEVFSASAWALENLGKRWTLVGVDFAFGQDQVNQWAERVEHLGGKALDKIMVPVGTDNVLPYLSRINQRETEVLFHAFFSASAAAFIKQAGNIGLLEKFTFIGTYDSVEGLDPAPFEGSYFYTPFPQRLSQAPEDLRPYDATLRRAIGVDEDGVDLRRSRPSGHAHNVLGWELMHLIKNAVEKTGYKSKKDSRDIIEFLQGHETVAGPQYPHGGKLIRAQDHQAFLDFYIQKVVNGKYELVGQAPREKGMYPPQGDLRV